MDPADLIRAATPEELAEINKVMARRLAMHFALRVGSTIAMVAAAHYLARKLEDKTPVTDED